VKGLAARLAARREAGLLRSLRAPHGVDLSSNDYLGMARHPRVAQAIMAALAQGVPAGSAGSRLLSGQHAAFDALEARVAAWQGREASLLFSSGYAANVGLLSALVGPHDRLISDALNHASLIDGARLSRAQKEIVPHLSAPDLAQALASPYKGETFVVVESVYSMDGDVAPLEEMATLCAQHGAHLIVDEAHATGLFGPQGAGRVAELGLQDQVLATVHPAGKALGQTGALVACDGQVRTALVQWARSFVFSTAPPPYLAAGLLAALDTLAADPTLRARPLQLGERLRERLAGRIPTYGSSTHIVPLHVGSPEAALALEAYLAERGWHARAIRPPTVPAGQCRVRLVLRADLTDDHIDTLASHLLESPWAGPANST